MKPKPIRLFSRAAMLLLMMTLTATTAWAWSGEGTSISYVDEKGDDATHEAIALDETMTTLSEGWYFVGKDITYTKKITLGGDVNIILADGKTMTTSSDSYGIDGYSNGYGLTIYGQTLGTGTLNATGTGTNGIGIYTDGTVTINGGTVNANGTDDVGIRSIDGVTINGGTVTTTGIMADGDVTINGGKVTATDDPGISSNSGNITLGWTSADDRITASSYSGTVTIASGKALVDAGDGNIYTGTLSSDEKSKLAGKTLTPACIITLPEGLTATGVLEQNSTTAYAKAGDAITLAVAFGYQLNSDITVTPAVTVTDLGNGTYSFTMPAANVTVTATLTTIDWAEESTGEDADHAYMIYNKDQLILLAYRVNGTHGETVKDYSGKYFKLGADIAFSYDPNEDIDNYAENYEAIGGIFDNTYRYFRGNFDGDGKTVSGIRLRKTGEWYQGLFGVTGTGANVHDVHLTDARISGFKMVGGIVGASYGTLSNCTVTQTDVTASYDIYRGIISGLNTGCPLSHNYYRYCTVNTAAVISGKGCGGADIDDNDGAMPMYVAYIDADGSEAKCFNYTELTGGDTQTLDGSTWYAVTDNIAYTGTLTLTANATIILADGKSLNIGTEDGRISSGSCISGSKYGLTIYGQTKGDGTLNAYNSTSSSPVDVKSYTQHGGTVNVDGTGMHAIWLSGNLTLTRGSLTANGHNHEAIHVGSNTVNVSGGTLTATSTTVGINGYLTMSGGTVTTTGYSGGTSSNGYGAISNNTTVSGGTLTANAPILGHVRLSGGTTTINGNGFGAVYGDLTLSGTTTATVSGKVIGTTSRNVIIANGQAFTDGNGHYYTGTLSNDERNAISGQTLTRLTAIQLADAADNTAAIDKCNGATDLDITLQGRTLYKDGNWNTLCLPFDLTIAGSTLDGADVRALHDASLTNGVLTLNFTNEDEVIAIEAGQPYIIKWVSGENLVNPVFTGVTISSTAVGQIPFTGGEFKGIYSPTNIYSADHENLFLGIGKNALNEDVSMLYWPSTTDYTLGAFRAYFHVDLTETNGVRDIVLNFEDGTQTTGIIGHTDITDNTDKASAAWYTLDGRKLDGKPTAKGLYVHGNRKVVIK